MEIQFRREKLRRRVEALRSGFRTSTGFRGSTRRRWSDSGG
jgi:hypothetical protein